MVAGRWLLLALMVLAGPLIWVAGVSDTADAAYAAASATDPTLRYFISNYAGPGRTFAGAFALINLMLLAILMPTARQLATDRAGTYLRAIVTSVLAAGLAWFEYRFSPVTENWGGDPDGWSLVRDHIAGWYDTLAFFWIVATLVTGAAIILLAGEAAVSAVRRRRVPADE